MEERFKVLYDGQNAFSILRGGGGRYLPRPVCPPSLLPITSHLWPCCTQTSVCVCHSCSLQLISQDHDQLNSSGLGNLAAASVRFKKTKIESVILRGPPVGVLLHRHQCWQRMCHGWASFFCYDGPTAAEPCHMLCSLAGGWFAAGILLLGIILRYPPRVRRRVERCALAVERSPPPVLTACVCHARAKVRR